MNKMVLTILLLVAPQLFASQKLVLVGGGPRPSSAMERFIDFAGGAKGSKILVITWATAEPVETFESIRTDLSEAANVIHAETAPLDVKRKKAFLIQLADATGVFFSGGDQNRIMDVLADSDLLKAVQSKYFGGTVFGGTSAGTAVVPEIMMTGDSDLTVIDGSKVKVRKGLGFLPNIIVDQHFIVRQRENRLFGLMFNHKNKVGLGIDEGMAVVIKDASAVEVFGPTQVIKVRASSHRLVLDFFKEGDTFSLNK